MEKVKEWQYELHVEKDYLLNVFDDSSLVNYIDNRKELDKSSLNLLEKSLRNSFARFFAKYESNEQFDFDIMPAFELNSYDSLAFILKVKNKELFDYIKLDEAMNKNLKGLDFIYLKL